MSPGLISHIQKYSLQDGPGIRTTVFLKGCPLSCAWCHNPENMSRRPEVMVLESRCVRCGQCLEVCPQNKAAGEGVIEGGHSNSPTPRPPLDCKLCGACVEACPSGARLIMGRNMTVKEVLSEILADRIFYEQSHGGVTFSGGEPLLQFEFLKCALEACQKEGIHTAIDTCGFVAQEQLLAIAPVTNLFLYDLKLMDPARHEQLTGVPNDLILKNLETLARLQAVIWLRVPLIPGITDTPAELESMARFAGSLPAIRQVNLLPYHRTGLQKFSRLGKEYPLPDLVPPSAESLQAAAATFSAHGLKVQVGG